MDACMHTHTHTHTHTDTHTHTHTHTYTHTHTHTHIYEMENYCAQQKRGERRKMDNCVVDARFICTGQNTRTFVHINF